MEFDCNMLLLESKTFKSIDSPGIFSFRYLHLTGDTYGRPIHGQKEISCYSYPNSQNIWKVDAGVYIRTSAESVSSTRDDQSNSRFQSTSADHYDDEL